MSTDITSFTKELIDNCIILTNNLGIDATKGDGITSAIQGLLFNFQVWGITPLEMKLYLLDSVFNLNYITGKIFWESIGVQTLLDIMRAYLFNIVVIDPDHNIILNKISDIMQNILTMTMLSIVEDATNSKSKKKKMLHSEIQMILHCIEESNSFQIVEILLNILLQVQKIAPKILLISFKKNKVSETIMSHIFNKFGSNLFIRKIILQLFIWQISEENLLVPEKLLDHKLNLLNVNYSRDISNEYIPDTYENISNHINKIVQSVYKSWSLVNTVAKLIKHTINDKKWGDLSTEINDKSPLYEILELLGHVRMINTHIYSFSFHIYFIFYIISYKF
jgi:hypothetical protein